MNSSGVELDDAIAREKLRRPAAEPALQRHLRAAAVDHEIGAFLVLVVERCQHLGFPAAEKRLSEDQARVVLALGEKHVQGQRGDAAEQISVRQPQQSARAVFRVVAETDRGRLRLALEDFDQNLARIADLGRRGSADVDARENTERVEAALHFE